MVFTKHAQAEPRLSIGDEVAPLNASVFFAVDVEQWSGENLEFKPSADFPLQSISQLEQGEWRVQALLDQNNVLSDLDSRGNYYSLPQTLQISSTPSSVNFNLSETVEEEVLPNDTRS